MATAVMKVEKVDSETCCVCGTGSDLVSPEEYDAAAPPPSPPLRAVLARLAGGAAPEGRLCSACLQRALEAHDFAAALRARAPPPLSEKIRQLRRRLAELTEQIDVFIVVGGGGKEGGRGGYSEDDIIMVQRGALAAAAEPAHARNARGDAVYQCSVCPLSFPSAAEYRSHAATHPSDSLHSCWTCGSQFPTRQALHDHTDEEHPQTHTTCYICNTTFQSGVELSRHAGRCGAVCPAAGCGLRCASRALLSAHCRSRHGAASGSGSGSVLCPHCYRALPGPAALSAHLLSHGPGPAHGSHYVCGYGDCVLRFPNRNSLLTHIRQCHTPETSPLTCQQCERTFATVPALRRHEKVHTTQVAAEGAGAECGGEGEGEVEYLEVETLDEELAGVRLKAEP